MKNQESILENVTHKILCDFEIQKNHLISARRPDLEIINIKKKENLLNRGFCFYSDYRIKFKEIEKKSK